MRPWAGREKRVVNQMPAMPARISSAELKSIMPVTARAEQVARHDHPHDLVGALKDLVHAQVTHDFLDAVILQIAVAAEQLQRAIRDAGSCFGHETLGHRAAHGGVRLLAVIGARRSVEEHARGFEIDRHIREAELQGLEILQAFPEGYPLGEIGLGLVEGRLRAAER